MGARREKPAEGESVVHLTRDMRECVHNVLYKTRTRVFFVRSCAGEPATSEPLWISREEYEEGAAYATDDDDLFREFYRTGSEKHENARRRQQTIFAYGSFMASVFGGLLDGVFGAQGKAPDAFHHGDPKVREAAQALGLAIPYTEQQLKDAWRKKALETHPDRGGTAQAFAHAKEHYKVCAAALGLKT